MTKNDILNNVSVRAGMSKASCENIIDIFIDEIKNCLIRGEKLVIKGFIVFDVSERAERDGRNPKTNQIMRFPAVKTIKCKISKTFKDAVNGK